MGEPFKTPRRHPRQRTSAFVWFQILGASKTQGSSRAVDLSPGGIGLITKRDLPVGSLVMLELTGESLSFAAVGRVIHSNPLNSSEYRVGLEFEAVPPNALAALSALTP